MIKRANIIVLIRFVLFIIAVFSGFLFEINYQKTYVLQTYFILLIIVIMEALISFFVINFLKINLKIFLFATLHFDLLLISFLLFLSGLSESPYIFLITFPIFVSAIFYSKREIYYFAFLSYVSFLFSLVLSVIVNKEEITFRGSISSLIMLLFSLGGISLLLAYLKDFIETTRVELVKKEEKFKELTTLFNSVFHGSRDGYIFVNDSMKVLFKNRSFDKLFKTPDLLFREINMEELKNKGKLMKEIEFGNRFFNVKGEKVDHKNGNTYFIMVSDITREKIAEERKKIDEKLRTMGEAAAGMAHEIRNPLASLLGAVQFLKENEDKNIIEKLIDMIVKDSKRISEIIEDFLTITESGRVRIEKVPIHEIVKEIEDEFEKDLKENKIKIEFNLKDKVCFVNRYHLFTILRNLVSNSIKAVKEKKDGKIVVSFLKKGSKIVVEVKDNGIGIKSENIKRVTEPFFSSFSAQGMGIGMALVRRIAELYDGRVLIKHEDEWTIVRVELKEGAGK